MRNAPPCFEHAQRTLDSDDRGQRVVREHGEHRQSRLRAVAEGRPPALRPMGSALLFERLPACNPRLPLGIGLYRPRLGLELVELLQRPARERVGVPLRDVRRGVGPKSEALLRDEHELARLESISTVGHVTWPCIDD